MSTTSVFYYDRQTLKIGGVSRYVVQFTRGPNHTADHLLVRIKNTENPGIRTIHLLDGPFSVYVDVIPCNYHQSAQFVPDTAENTEICYKNMLKPGKTFNVELKLNENAKSSENVYRWTIDVVSQIVVSSRGDVGYELAMGDGNQTSRQMKVATAGLDSSDYGKPLIESLTVDKKSHDDLWSKPPASPQNPVHLVFITHGLFSNLTADMLYLKERIEAKSAISENVMVRGYTENAGKTDKGVKKLGRRQAHFLMDLLKSSPYKIDRISFIGHSLGGLVQLYTIRYIESYHPELLRNITPVNFITLASPYLGIYHEFPPFITIFLDLGVLGKTGRDLTLSKKLPSLHEDKSNPDSYKFRAILDILPEDPLHSYMKRFKSLTLYANVINDGIVPLRTASLLYLDWEALDEINDKTHEDGENDEKKKNGKKNEITHEPHKSGSFQEVPFSANLDKILSFNNMAQSSKEKKFRTILAKSSDLMGPSLVTDGSDDMDGQTSQVGSSDSTTDLKDEQPPKPSTKTNSSKTEGNLRIPPKASPVKSAFNALYSPVPDSDFIFNPKKRLNTIYHDKIYKFDDLPPPAKLGTFRRVKNFIMNEKIYTQLRIARTYHQDLVWRKVLVKLPPDAHNNIAVRRRFTNAFGWSVIDHLCDNMFNGE